MKQVRFLSTGFYYSKTLGMDDTLYTLSVVHPLKSTIGELQGYFDDDLADELISDGLAEEIV